MSFNIIIKIMFKRVTKIVLKRVQGCEDLYSNITRNSSML